MLSPRRIIYYFTPIALSSAAMHLKCRDVERPYLRSTVHRVEVPDEKVEWNTEWPSYSPTVYTDPSTKNKPWADRDIGAAVFKWNQIDGKTDRRSHIGQYIIDSHGYPLNPMGRTGLRGRGVLGKWGPNHAADPVVTRLHKGELQFVAIKRRDNGEWAIPGGMVDPGEAVSVTLKREFTEEALEGVTNKDIEELWKKGVELYRGYVDDPRNTDNAWMETVVVNFHDDGKLLECAEFKAGDDAVGVRWINANSSEKLYASHEHFIELLLRHHGIPVQK